MDCGFLLLSDPWTYPDYSLPPVRYEEVADLPKLNQLLEDYLDEYNLVNTNPLNLGEHGKAMEDSSNWDSCKNLP